MTDQDIIKTLGGVNAVARLLGVRPPSVSNWLKRGIPDSRLREMGAQIEIKSGGAFSRKERWPENYAIYWPELAENQGA